MPKLPVISGAEAIKKFERAGYYVARQKGNHVRLRTDEKNRFPLTIPLHKTLKAGLLSDLIKDAGLTVQEFKDL